MSVKEITEYRDIKFCSESFLQVSNFKSGLVKKYEIRWDAGTYKILVAESHFRDKYRWEDEMIE